MLSLEPTELPRLLAKTCSHRLATRSRPETPGNAAHAQMLRVVTSNTAEEKQKMHDWYHRTAESKYLSHQFLTPKTVALPSSRRSVPSGFPMMIAKIQNEADTHTAAATPRLKTGAARYTAIKQSGL
jgi:hypothetical protein